MPVFNGEKYLREALDSLLSQTYQNFELIISDNASTDQTPQICREYAAKDSRIRYYRNKKNIGAPKNYNRVFELSSSEYFKWAAYDDVHAPEYLEKCVAILDRDPSIVLCHSRTARIDEYGKVVGNYDHRSLMKISSWKSHERFGDLISIRNPCWYIFGVIRSSVLKMTRLHGSYIGADRNLLAEIGLLGRMHEIPEYLFFRRDHPQAYTRTFCEHAFAIDLENYQEQLSWWTGEKSDHATYFPNWKCFFEFLRSVQHVPINWSEKLLCYGQIWKWFVKEGWMFLSSDVESVLMRRSRLAKKFIPAVKFQLNRTLINSIRKMRH
jgi:glycosyltransferase involved in cell wall biosynthesis